MSSEAMPARIPRLGWAIAFVLFAVILTGAYVSLRGTRPSASTLPRYAPAPSFQLTSQEGKPVSNADLAGKVWVANFVFTRCNGPCPLITTRMAALNQNLGSRFEDVRLVTITVDPEYDTPQVLKEYSERVAASPERWKFLTGTPADIEKIVMKGFLQPLAKEPSGAPVHSTRFVLVDRDGWMRSFQDGNDPEVVQKLMVDIGDILREPSKVNAK